MRVIVCGGRNYSDKEFVFKCLSQYNIQLIIQGGASGADSLAKEYAKLNNIQMLEFLADWDHHGAMAGPIRNQLMIERNPDMVIAFPGGKGTRDMIKRSLKYKVPVLEYFEFEGEIKCVLHEIR